MKIRFIFLCSICSIVYLLFGSLELIAAENDQQPDIVIIYTGDARGAAEPTGCCSKIGGMARRATKIKQMKEIYKQALLVDSGDYLWENRKDVYDPIRVKSVRQALQMIGYDAINIADGEISLWSLFDEYFLSNPVLPLVSSNIFSGASETKWNPYLVQQVNDIKIGILAVTSLSFTGKTADSELIIEDPEKSLKKYIGIIRKEADIIVLLSHLGWNKSKEIVRQIQDIDVAIVGHDTYPTFNPEQIGKTLMVKNAFGGGLIGIIRLWLDQSDQIDKMESDFEILESKIRPYPEHAKLESDYLTDRNQYLRKIMNEEKLKDVQKEMNQYLKMTPEQFIQQMKKEGRIVSPEQTKKN